MQTGRAIRLNVDVDDLAGRRAFIAADRLGRLERRQPIEAQAFEDATDGGDRDADFRSDLLAGWRCLRKASTLLQAPGPVWLGDEWGREERSIKPAGPSARNRATHLPTGSASVELARRGRLRQTAFHHAARHSLSTSGRKQGVLVRVHSVLRESLTFDDISVHRSDQMDNLLKDHD